jgi:hypothetical protein
MRILGEIGPEAADAVPAIMDTWGSVETRQIFIAIKEIGYTATPFLLEEVKKADRAGNTERLIRGLMLLGSAFDSRSNADQLKGAARKELVALLESLLTRDDAAGSEAYYVLLRLGERTVTPGHDWRYDFEKLQKTRSSGARLANEPGLEGKIKAFLDGKVSIQKLRVGSLTMEVPIRLEVSDYTEEKALEGTVLIPPATPKIVSTTRLPDTLLLHVLVNPVKFDPVRFVEYVDRRFGRTAVDKDQWNLARGLFLRQMGVTQGARLAESDEAPVDVSQLMRELVGVMTAQIESRVNEPPLSIEAKIDNELRPRFQKILLQRAGHDAFAFVFYMEFKELEETLGQKIIALDKELGPVIEKARVEARKSQKLEVPPALVSQIQDINHRLGSVRILRGFTQEMIRHMDALRSGARLATKEEVARMLKFESPVTSEIVASRIVMKAKYGSVDPLRAALEINAYLEELSRPETDLRQLANRTLRDLSKEPFISIRGREILQSMTNDLLARETRRDQAGMSYRNIGLTPKQAAFAKSLLGEIKANELINFRFRSQGARLAGATPRPHWVKNEHVRQIISQKRKDLLPRYVQGLPERERLVVKLRMGLGTKDDKTYRFKEMAQKFGTTPGALGKTYKEAQEMLRERYKESRGDNPLPMQLADHREVRLFEWFGVTPDHPNYVILKSNFNKYVQDRRKGMADLEPIRAKLAQDLIRYAAPPDLASFKFSEFFGARLSTSFIGTAEAAQNTFSNDLPAVQAIIRGLLDPKTPKEGLIEVTPFKFGEGNALIKAKLAKDRKSGEILFYNLSRKDDTGAMVMLHKMDLTQELIERAKQSPQEAKISLAQQAIRESEVFQAFLEDQRSTQFARQMYGKAKVDTSIPVVLRFVTKEPMRAEKAGFYLAQAQTLRSFAGQNIFIQFATINDAAETTLYGPSDTAPANRPDLKVVYMGELSETALKAAQNDGAGFAPIEDVADDGTLIPFVAEGAFLTAAARVDAVTEPLRQLWNNVRSDMTMDLDGEALKDLQKVQTPSPDRYRRLGLKKIVKIAWEGVIEYTRMALQAIGSAA